VAAFLQWRMSEATAEARPAMASGCGSVLRAVRARGKQMGQALALFWSADARRGGLGSA